MLKRIMLFLLAACLPLAAPALAEGGERPQIILMACYQQVGWGRLRRCGVPGLKRAEFGTTKTENGGCQEKTPNGWNCWVKLKDVEHVGAVGQTQGGRKFRKPDRCHTA